jgi:outer membrane protein OmpA-like peptidoglycan-associated protein
MPRLALVSSCLVIIPVVIPALAPVAAADPDAFHPAVDSRGYLTLDGSSMLGHEELSFGLGSLEWGRHVSTGVDNVVSATLVAAMGLELGPVPLELGASMPFTITSGTTDTQGVGDAGFHAKVHLARLGRVGVAAIASVYVPTSAGDHGAAPQLVGVADAGVGRWRFAVNGGVRRTTTLGMSETVAPVGAAAAWAVAPEKFELVGEVFGTLGGPARLEALGGVKLYLAKNSYLSLGAGRGVTEAAGTPDFRAVIGIVFEPKAAMRGSARIVEDVEPPAVPQVAKTDFPDRDNDGIRDDLDKCPDDPETYNGYLDDDGCPDDDRDAPALADGDDPCTRDPDACPDRHRVIVKQTAIITLDTIEFEFDKAIISRRSYPILDAVAAALHANPDIQLVEVKGHTDERGDDAYNLDLSNRRAAAVVTYLTAHGIDADRLTSTGYGETMPIDPSHTEAAWAKNRRVEFQIRKRGGELM